MATLSQAEKQAIHDDLVNRVATWVTGPRVEVVLDIARRVLGEPDEEPAPTPEPEPAQPDEGRKVRGTHADTQ